MNLNESIELYKSVGARNADFLFNWLNKVYSNLYLPCINPDFKEILAEDKTKLTIFDVLVDDLADNEELRDEELLNEFMKIPWSNKKYENKYLDAGRIIWEDAISSIKKYPRFKEFEKMFYFDLKQVLNSMEYSYLSNTMHLDNSFENNLYNAHGCMVVLHSGMDLMCSPSFDVKELGYARIVFSLAQKISHIGNMLNTYPREIQERDFSSPIISLAVKRGLFKREELSEEKLPILKELESEYRQKVDSYLQELKGYEDKIKSVDIRGFSELESKLFNDFLVRNQYWR